MTETTDWMSFRKTHYPRLRRTHPVGITHNGSIRRVYSCICGEEISMDARWPMTVRVCEFHASHADCRCLPEEK
jgi:hypothetical protein